MEAHSANHLLTTEQREMVIRVMSTQSLSEIEFSDEPYRFPTVVSAHAFYG